MSNLLCMRFVVTGKVQGVWFRASTKQQADELNLTGWVCNLEDGSVEVLACGEQKQLQLLADWLHRGPNLAEVDEVMTESLPFSHYETFTIKR